MSDQTLGRLPAPDPRDTAYRAADHVLRRVPKRLPAVGRKYHWARGWLGDQGALPACVGYAWTHWLEDGPTTHRDRSPGAAPIVSPATLYREAQRIDEWPGEDYEGTSVRAGAKALQAQGLIGSYYWAWSLNDALIAVEKQPVVVGTWWYTGMFEPDTKGLVRVTGFAEGGHAYVANGVNWEMRRVRIKNSWGVGWGRNGHAYVSFDDFARLIAEDGEVCYAEEMKDAA